MKIAWENRIGGMLAPEPLPQTGNSLLEGIMCAGDDLRHMMSGRCGIMLCIADWSLTDTRRVAYLPAYTCETVSGCFEKSGYELLYYDVDEALRPVIDEEALERVSLSLICGYYGFPTFNVEFAQKCRDRGIGVIVDTTHSIFTEGGIPEAAQYVAGSFRKWLPVSCGGFAIKRDGEFGVQPQPIHAEHMARRTRFYGLLEQAQAARSDDLLQSATQAFWDAEMLLRDVYGWQESDAASIDVVNRYPVQALCDRRRANFAALLAHFPDTPWATPVFRQLPEGVVPSHFPVYAPRREALQQALRDQGIASTVYWPVPPFIDIAGYPGAQQVYERILSLPCDQRYGPAEMERVCAALRGIDLDAAQA